MTIERIDPERARAHMTSSHALLVCAYDSPEQYRDNHLDGAISLQDLQAMEGQLPRNQEIIFYCA
jgi:hypothetical protein